MKISFVVSVIAGCRGMRWRSFPLIGVIARSEQGEGRGNPRTMTNQASCYRPIRMITELPRLADAQLAMTDKY